MSEVEKIRDMLRKRGCPEKTIEKIIQWYVCEIDNAKISRKRK